MEKRERVRVQLPQLHLFQDFQEFLLSDDIPVESMHEESLHIICHLNASENEMIQLLYLAEIKAV